MGTDIKASLESLICAPGAAEKVPVAQIPFLLERLAGLQQRLSFRLVRSAETSMQPRCPVDEPRLLKVGQVAEILGVSARWLYERADQLPFARKLSKKALRFSEAGLRRWMATKRDLDVD